MNDKIKKYNLAIQSIQHLIKPMKERLDIEALIEEQHYKGADKGFIDILADNIKIKEPIEELLKII